MLNTLPVIERDSSVMRCTASAATSLACTSSPSRWIPLFVSPADYGAAMGRLDKEIERAGRQPAEVARAIVAFVSVGARSAADRGRAWMSSLYGLPTKMFSHHLVAGDARTCASSLARFIAAGASHVAVFVTDDKPLARFGELAGEFADLTARR